MRKRRRQESVEVQPGLEMVDRETTETESRETESRQSASMQDEGRETESRELPALISKALKAFEDRLQSEDFRPSLADYLKLLQFEQELKKHDKKPTEIKVTWVEPASICSGE